LLNYGPSFFAPCRNEKGCPKGTPEKPKTLHPINQQAHQHYQECRAVGRFPDDPIVLRNASIIREITDSINADIQRQFRKLMIRLAVK
jgi:hypothetical protein